MSDLYCQRLIAAVRGLILLLMLLHGPVYSAIDVYEFEDDTLRQRYLDFIEELRCPKCQNQNLAGSDSPIAADLRRELRRLLEEGKSDREIIDFMVNRYGDYVLYRPKVQANTLVLWGLPGLLLVVGLLTLAVIVRRRTRSLPDSNELEQQERQRLTGLLEQAAERERRGDDVNKSGT